MPEPTLAHSLDISLHDPNLVNGDARAEFHFISLRVDHTNIKSDFKYIVLLFNPFTLYEERNKK